MPSLLEERRHVNSSSVAAVFDQMLALLLSQVTASLDLQSLAAVEWLLARPFHQRRARVAPWITSGTCQRCGSQQSPDQFEQNHALSC